MEKPEKLQFEIEGKVRELGARREDPGCTRKCGQRLQVQRAGVIRGSARRQE